MSTQLETKAMEYLHFAKRDALLLLRAPFATAVNAPGRSYFGGLPALPPSVEWPEVLDQGDSKALLFAGQMDLEDLPNHAVRDVLPRHGTLYFFYAEDWVLGRTDPEGYLRNKVIFHPGASQTFQPRLPPKRRFSLQDHDAAPRWIEHSDHRLSGGFRYDIQFRAFHSFPEMEDESYGRDSVEEESMAVADCYRRLQADSIILALNGLRPAATVFRPEEIFPPAADWIICWTIIRNYAKGIFMAKTPESSPTAEEANQERRIEDKARRWAARSETEDQFTVPAPDAQTEFFEWTQSLREAAQHCGWGLRSRLYSAWRESARDAVNRLSESGRLAQVPSEMIEWLHPALDFTDYRAVDIQMPRHQMFGHGSHDHAVIYPDEKRESVLLLRIAGNDHPGFGSFGSEGAHHYWISRDALQTRNFSKVELTC